MKNIMYLIGQFGPYKRYIIISIGFQLITAILTVVSIPFVIPFFQILFDVSPSDYPPPESWSDIQGALTYGFSRLIAISDKRNALALVCFVVLGVVFLRNLSRFLSGYFLIPARNGVLRDLRKDLVTSFEKMSLTERYSYKKGQLLSSLSHDLNEIDHGLLKATELLVKSPLIIIGCLVFMIVISTKLALIAIGISSLIFLFIAVGSNYLKKASPELHDIQGEINVRADEYLSNKKLIEAYNAQDFFGNKASDLIERQNALSIKMLRRRDLASPLSELLLVGLTVLILYVAAYMVFDKELLPETFFAFIFAFFSIIDPAKNFSREYYNVQKSGASLSRVKDIISNVEAEDTINNTELSKLTFNESIQFHNVIFSYDSQDDKVLNGMDLTISKGEKLAIVGGSGVGKTTIVDLLLRFYDLEQGRITLDNAAIDEFSLHQYRNLFGLVTQDHKLFHLSIRENIGLSDEIVDDRLREALDRAKIHNVAIYDGPI